MKIVYRWRDRLQVGRSKQIDDRPQVRGLSTGILEDFSQGGRSFKVGRSSTGRIIVYKWEDLPQVEWSSKGEKIAFSKKIIQKVWRYSIGKRFFTVERIVYRWKKFSLVGIKSPEKIGFRDRYTVYDEWQMEWWSSTTIESMDVVQMSRSFTCNDSVERSEVLQGKQDF